MRKHPLFQMIVIGAIATAIGIAIVLAIPWFPVQASAEAHRVDTLYDVLLIASVPIFVMVLTVIMYSVWKFRMRPGEENRDGPPIHGNTRVEVVWTVLPVLLIVGLCTYAFTVLRANEKTHRGMTTINVIGEQFAWMFSYPRPDGQAIVSPQLYLADNQPVEFKLHSRDVIHEFYVPAFRVGLDAVPGITGTLRATPTRLGSYVIACAELCGNGHSLMRATAHVLPPAAFAAWLSSQKPQPAPSYGFAAPAAAGAPAAAAPAAPAAPAAGATGPSAAGSSTASGAPGKAIFTGAGGCGACHTLAAAGSTGAVGPNLDLKLRADCSSAASQRARGATLSKCISTAITKPYAFLPSGYQSGIMPANFAQSLSATQIQALVTFIASVTK